MQPHAPSAIMIARLPLRFILLDRDLNCVASYLGRFALVYLAATSRTLRFASSMPKTNYFRSAGARRDEERPLLQVKKPRTRAR